MTKRHKLFQKIAQTTTTTTTTVDPAAPAVPTTVPGSPRSVTIESAFPTFVQAWGANAKAPVNELLDVLNQSIFVLSIGSLDLENLRSNHFIVDTSKYPDAFLSGVVSFGNLVYNYILNAGKPFKTQVPNKKEIIAKLVQQLNTNGKIPDSFSNSFPQSFLQTKIGNFKPKVISILTELNSLVQ